MDASDIATSESRSEELGKGTSFACFPFCSALVRRVTRLHANVLGLTVGATSSNSAENFLLTAMVEDEDKGTKGQQQGDGIAWAGVLSR